MSEDTPKEFWDARYSESGYAYGVRPSRLLLAWSDTISKSGTKAFVPGCGEGRDAVFLAMMGLQVTAVDMSPVGLEKARTLAERNGVSIETVEADLRDYPLEPESFDCIASVFVHMPESERNSYHQKLSASLRPGGLIFLEGFRKLQLQYQASHNSGGPTDKSMLFAPPQIEQDFSDLEQVSLMSGVENLAEGPYHDGSAAIMRAVFRKMGDMDV